MRLWKHRTIDRQIRTIPGSNVQRTCEYVWETSVFDRTIELTSEWLFVDSHWREVQNSSFVWRSVSAAERTRPRNIVFLWRSSRMKTCPWMAKKRKRKIIKRWHTGCRVTTTTAAWVTPYWPNHDGMVGNHVSSSPTLSLVTIQATKEIKIDLSGFAGPGHGESGHGRKWR